MILPFSQYKRINGFGATSSKTSTRTGQRLITADSTTPNLTVRSMPSVEEEMSYRWMTAILPLSLPANEKSVLNILAFHANEDGECWPSVSLLARECCLSTREVQKCLAWLDTHNFIERDFRDGRSTTYCVNEPLSNSHPHPRPLDTQNGLLNAGEEKFQSSASCVKANCACAGGKERHHGCTILPVGYIIGVSKKKRKSL